VVESFVTLLHPLGPMRDSGCPQNAVLNWSLNGGNLAAVCHSVILSFYRPQILINIPLPNNGSVISGTILSFPIVKKDGNTGQ